MNLFPQRNEDGTGDTENKEVQFQKIKNMTQNINLKLVPDNKKNSAHRMNEQHRM